MTSSSAISVVSGRDRPLRAGGGVQFLLLAVLCGVACSSLSARMQSDGLVMAVRAVLNGDTLRIGGRRVGLLGIDAPEIGVGFNSAAPFAREARDRLASLVIARFVRLEFDGNRRGRAYVFTDDGVFVNAAIVRAGLARATGPRTLKRIGELRAAEAEARAARRGIWSTPPSAPAPRR